MSFTQSGETQCVNVSILKDRVDEPNEFFLLDLTLNYAAFNIPLTTLSVTILDSGELAEFTIQWGRLTFLKLGSASAGFSGCVWNFSLQEHPTLKVECNTFGCMAGIAPLICQLKTSGVLYLLWSMNTPITVFFVLSLSTCRHSWNWFWRRSNYCSWNCWNC